ncbi:MAG: hypothetical protein R6X28_05540 [Bacteroidales bacterium]
MKKYKLLLLTFVCISPLYSQTPPNSEVFLKETLGQHFIGQSELLSQYDTTNFSSLWTRNDDLILGFIGDNYQRIKIKFLKVIKKGKENNTYYVYGKSLVKSNICQFMGEIEIIHLREVIDKERQQLYKEAIKQRDERAIERFSKKEFILIAKYTFFEDINQKGSGFFKGITKSRLFLYKDKLSSYDTESLGDSYSNNQFVGIWTSYVTGVVKKCNWGVFRIPYSGDLDIGVGEFSPNPKYFQNGWYNYYKAFILNDKEAKIKELQSWW